MKPLTENVSSNSKPRLKAATATHSNLLTAILHGGLHLFIYLKICFRQVQMFPLNWPTEMSLKLQNGFNSRNVHYCTFISKFLNRSSLKFKFKITRGVKFPCARKNVEKRPRQDVWRKTWCLSKKKLNELLKVRFKTMIFDNYMSHNNNNTFL